MKLLINVAEKFPFPGARYKDLGPQSGEEFKEFLIQKIKEAYGNDFTNTDGKKIIINLDGSAGYGSSFLEEGFGGLIRAGVPIQIARDIKLISSEEPELIDEIKDYISSAAKLAGDK
ncbi:STAS-like domain-containing protein [uncultured Pantoea sp.]|uniref:STAS-like domain-containing protein n=1 Tax=uncultured Pantoea sp. TaxID=218084 RepID=UPI00258C4CEA|nr:STAS-like domain-containing protein [uncultured Pantoea sp.]